MSRATCPTLHAQDAYYLYYLRTMYKLTRKITETAAGLQKIAARCHASFFGALMLRACTKSHECLGLFRSWLSSVGVRNPCDIGCKSWSKKL